LKKVIDIFDRDMIRKARSYIAVGATTFVIYYFFVWTLYSFFKISYLISITISYILAITFHFLTNRKVTFNVFGKKYLRQIFRYFIVAAVNYLIQMSVVSMLHGYLGINLYVSLLFGISVTVIIGFTLLNYWVFRVHHDNSAQST